MSVTIHELLDELRATALDQRDKGDRFERLIKAYLLNEPEWTARFEDVWLWSEWPDRGARSDTGIDLVAKRRDGEGLAAIQCKFYAPGHKVAKADIDSFIAASAKAEWTERYVFDTAAGWSGNAEETLQGVAQRIDISFLDDARVDWSQYSWSKPDTVELAKAHQPRRHQKAAITDVIKGLAEHDRGKLIMACGTGKTFTALRLAEQMVGEDGSVLFLVPSIQLLSQSLREWMAQAELDIRPFAVCSDVRVGRKNDDSGDLSTIDLTEPATTDAQTLVARMSVGRHAKGRMTVVFSTYQSIDVISQAQLMGLDPFDLVICDEAHRTTGVTLSGQDSSHFVKVHDNGFLQAKKRLYMTATPRVFDDAVTKKAVENDAVLADMGDETTFGPELHRLGFGDAVEQNLLTDYKVLVLTVDEAYVASHFQKAMAESGEIPLDDAAKLLGCWNGLAKNFGPNSPEPQDTNGTDSIHVTDRAPMRRAVAFAKDIRSSKAAATALPALVERALQDEARRATNDLRIEAAHVDGTMGISERNSHLDWLKADSEPGTCRVLTNARCLSEGVDVPALDAVMFLTPRGSQVDVVQSVGRVMRKDPTGEKKLGYIILPVVVPTAMSASEALADNKRYKVVWQVLQALRSHDDRFHAMVNQIDLNKKKNTKVDIIDGTPRPAGDEADTNSGTDSGTDASGDGSVQVTLDYGFEGFRDAMYARIVRKVGERTYWEDWASDIAEIARTHIARITGLIDSSPEAATAFEGFLNGLRGNLNESISTAEAIEMLAQHLITRPVFEALFAGYDFTGNNPIAQTMERMLVTLDEHALESESQTLEGFYDSVRRRVAGVDNAEGRQKILVELYNNFFAKAFKRTVDKLGIVYTPVEIVDFILRSADEVLRAEFGQSLSDEGVHILDGFTGTGTFIVRLMQLGLIDAHDLARKYAEEIHANEILLLAYYIAAANIESTYADLTGEPAPFPGLILTDTFQSYEEGDRQDLNVFPVNNERIVKQTQLPITVIVGNPPYSVGQGSNNDNNENESYPALDAAIRDTYAARSSAKLKAKIYDSYVRALKWATLRIKERGVIALVTNGGFLSANSADGIRRSLADEFTSIYIFNLRGNQRTAGEESRKEGGKIFGSGSRATVAITLLVKNPETAGPATIRYSDVGEYLSREEKLSRVAAFVSFQGLPSTPITPNADADWYQQRSSDFPTFPDLKALLGQTSLGVGTARDAWVYASSSKVLHLAVIRHIETYESERERWLGRSSSDSRTIEEFVLSDTTKASWGGDIRKHIERNRPVHFEVDSTRIACYRPFFRQFLYLDPTLNNRVASQPELFPGGKVENFGFYVLNPGTDKPFSALMLERPPDLAFYGSNAGHFHPRWRYEQMEPEEGSLGLTAAPNDADGIIDGYRKVDNITDSALAKFVAAYPDEGVAKGDIFFYVYGLLHSPIYRHTYAADLKKMLPRIPFVRDFRGFADAGRALSDLHLNYESVEPYPLKGLDVAPAPAVDPYDFYAVGSSKMKFGKPTPEQKAAGEKYDRTVIHYNDRITLTGIPTEAYRYQLGSRSAIEWIIDRYHIKTDKASGIVNDPNDWSREVGDPRYILDLLARIVTVSLETMKIVDGLPELEIIGSKTGVASSIGH